MNILGLSYGFHDASAALVVDGRLVASSREETHTRQKHDSFYPKFAIESCLRKAGIDLKEVERVAYYERTEKKWTRVLSSSLRNWPLSHREFQTSMKSWLGGKLWTEALLCKKLNLPEESVVSFEHHQSHAAQAFIGSEFDDAAVLTIDAVGEWETCTQYKASWEGGRPLFRKLKSSLYPHSLGLFYSAITDYLGFQPMNDECSTMALSAFGTDEYLERMRQCVAVNEDGEVRLNDKHFQFDSYFSRPCTKEFIKVFGEPSKIKYRFSSLDPHRPSREELRFASIAFAAQKVFEECALRLARNLRVNFQSKNLCLAGGAALNCVSNSRLLRESGFENIFIPRDPGDGGASIGAAYLAYFEGSKVDEPIRNFDISHGETYSQEDYKSVVDCIKPSKIQKHKKIGLKKYFKEQWLTTSCESSDLVNKVSQLIEKGQVVGWFQEGVENGPRALGYRSILFRADDRELAKRVSHCIKDRASFRPYALSMTEQAAKLVLDIEDISSQSLRYMQLAVKVSDDFIDRLRGGLHIDNTTRPQVVYRNENPRYYDLLERYGEKSGVASLVNTSFNESGYPVVEAPADALMMFARTDMDVLVLNNLIIEKKRSGHE